MTRASRCDQPTCNLNGEPTGLHVEDEAKCSHSPGLLFVLHEYNPYSVGSVVYLACSWGGGRRTISQSFL